MSDVASPVRPTHVVLSIMSYLATGWYPWGHEDEMIVLSGVGRPFLVQSSSFKTGRLEKDRFAKCCGYVLGPTVTRQLMAAGLIEDLPPVAFYGDSRLIGITEAGRKWLHNNWQRFRQGRG